MSWLKKYRRRLRVGQLNFPQMFTPVELRQEMTYKFLQYNPYAPAVVVYLFSGVLLRQALMRLQEAWLHLGRGGR